MSSLTLPCRIHLHWKLSRGEVGLGMSIKRTGVGPGQEQVLRKSTPTEFGDHAYGTSSLAVLSAILGGWEPEFIPKCLLDKDGHAPIGPRPKLSASNLWQAEFSKAPRDAHPLEPRPCRVSSP